MYNQLLYIESTLNNSFTPYSVIASVFGYEILRTHEKENVYF